MVVEAIKPKYIVDDEGRKVSVILSIDEYEKLLVQSDIDDLSKYKDMIVDGENSSLVEKSHKEVFKSLKERYV